MGPLGAGMHAYKEVANSNGGNGAVISECDLDGVHEQGVRVEPVSTGTHDARCS
jgi:hypothetical protein